MECPKVFEISHEPDAVIHFPELPDQRSDDLMGLLRWNGEDAEGRRGLLESDWMLVARAAEISNSHKDLRERHVGQFHRLDGRTYLFRAGRDRNFLHNALFELGHQFVERPRCQ